MSDIEKLRVEFNAAFENWQSEGGDDHQRSVSLGDDLAVSALPYVRALEARATKAEARVVELEGALHHVRAIISEGATTGFQPLEGDWATRLFESQSLTRAALSPACGTDHGEGEGSSRNSGQRGCGERDDLAGGATAALASGWVAVPYHCTMEMIQAGEDEYANPLPVSGPDGKDADWVSPIQAAWYAMIGAAPTPAPMGDA